MEKAEMLEATKGLTKEQIYAAARLYKRQGIEDALEEQLWIYLENEYDLTDEETLQKDMRIFHDAGAVDEIASRFEDIAAGCHNVDEDKTFGDLIYRYLEEHSDVEEKLLKEDMDELDHENVRELAEKLRKDDRFTIRLANDAYGTQGVICHVDAPFGGTEIYFSEYAELFDSAEEYIKEVGEDIAWREVAKAIIDMAEELNDDIDDEGHMYLAMLDGK